MNKDLIKQIDSVERIAKYSKFGRLLNNPFKYISAIFYREFIYPKTQKGKLLEANLFFGKKMRVALPAATDIYLTGGKSHSSEIRLAKFLILNLNAGNHFLDIGAHFGYFTLLASEVVGAKGKVISFEPAKKNFSLLNENTAGVENISIYSKAVSNSKDDLVFYEFPNLHSEYNTSDISQFENEAWFKTSPPQKIVVEATTIDTITSDNKFQPQIIKIDVEGAEYHVIQGGMNYFKMHSPIIIMEYLEPSRKNDSHKKATDLLVSMEYVSHIISAKGELKALVDIDNYLINEKLESDNVVFVKNK